MRNFIFIFITVFVVSCGTTGERVIADNYNYTLEEGQTISFPLDTTQSFYFKYIQYDPSHEKLYLFNSFNNSIYQYDYLGGNFEQKIQLETEGPNGVGPTTRMGFLMEGDTVHLMNYKTSRLLTMVNGNIARQIDLMPKQFESEGFPEATVFNPILSTGRDIQIISQTVDPREDNTKLTNLITIDRSTGAVNRRINRPDIYNKGYWGMLNLYRVSHAINSEKNENAFCFPVTGELLVYNDQFNLVKKAGLQSDLFNNEDMVPIRGTSAKDGLNFINKKRPQAQKHDLTISHYGPIYFDQFRKLYYVFTSIGLTDKEYNDPDKFTKYPLKHSIIVLDENFSKLCEYLLPRNKYFVGGVVVTRDGLLIANSELYDENEDALPFTQFVLKQKAK